MNVEFAYPWVFLLLLLVPVLAVWLLLPRLRRDRTPTFVFSAAHRLAGGRGGPRILLHSVIDILFVAGLAFIIIAMARPQIVEYESTEVEGIDIFVAFDMSGSMRAIDLGEAEVRAMENRNERPRNRFEEAKLTLSDFIGSRPNDRIGIVLFAEEAFLQFPLTLDHGLLMDQVDQLELGDIDANGTAIGNAVGRSLAGLTHSEADSKLLILITDGDRRGGNISPMQAAEMAKEMGVAIYPILVGREGEALVSAGTHPFTGQTSYRRVEFPIDPDLLQRMAELTNGQYFRALDAVSMRDDLHEILDRYDRTQLEDQGRSQTQEHYHLFVLIALFLIGIHFLARHTLCRSFP